MASFIALLCVYLLIEASASLLPDQYEDWQSLKKLVILLYLFIHVAM